MTRRELIESSISALTAGLVATSASAAGIRHPDGKVVATGAEFLLARSTDGLPLSGAMYGQKGSPEILLLHGLGQSRLAWEHQIAALSGAFRIAAFDLRGHGDSGRPDDVETYADGKRWADDVKAMIAAANLQRPIIVGWSFGGLVTGLYLRDHGAGNVRGVMLAGPVTRLDPALLGDKALDVGAGLVSSDLVVRTRAIVETVEATFAQPLPSDVFGKMLVVNGMAPRALHMGYGKIDQRGIDEAFGWPDRMLAIYGARDLITKPEMSRRLIDLNPRTRLVIFEKSGHAPQYDERDRFNRELASFAAA